MDNAAVKYQLKDHVGVITIDNPPVNALSHAVRQGIVDALEAATREEAKALVIVCAGKTFIAGADIKEFGKPPQPPGLPEVIKAIESQAIPVEIGRAHV